ncbi:hypothetical protein [Rhodococcus sp. KRD162]|uniref:hypothetical protein n=1 Tax=Rhodococcus sp. KRD162 TaxID=2729725 RepID=UPI0019D0DFA7|nr:hypothetical protein [Rhodococcus sp. KRD162]
MSYVAVASRLGQITDPHLAGVIVGVRRAVTAEATGQRCPMPSAVSIPVRFASGEQRAADLWPVAAHGYLDGVRAGIGAVTETDDPEWFAQESQVVSGFVSALAAAEWAVSARDVVDVLDNPHRWNRQFSLWQVLGSPGPMDAESDSLVWSVWTWVLDAISETNIGTPDSIREII